MAKARTGRVSKVALKSNPEAIFNVVSQDKEKVVLNPVGTEDQIEIAPKEFIRNYNIVDIKMDEIPQPQKTAATTPRPAGQSQPKEGTKSEQIRQMLSEGKSVAEVAKATNSHYSFVWGVAQRFFKGNIPTSNKSKGDSLSQKIRDMYDAGKSKSEIKKALLVDYSFVYSVIKAYELKLNKNKPIPTTEAVPEVQEA